MENRYEIYLPCVLQYCLSIEYSVLTVFVFCRTEREPHRGGRTHTFTAEQETEIVNMVRENNAITRFTVLYCSVCTEIKKCCCIFVCCFIFDYEKSRPTLRHFTKGEMAHYPVIVIHMVCSITMIVFSILHCSVL